MVWWRIDLQKCRYLFSQLPLPSSNSEKDFLLFVSLFFSWYYFSTLFFLLPTPKPQSHADWVADQFKQRGFQLLNADQQKCCGLCSTLSLATQLRIQVWRQEECRNWILAAHTLLTLSLWVSFLFLHHVPPVLSRPCKSSSLSLAFTLPLCPIPLCHSLLPLLTLLPKLNVLLLISLQPIQSPVSACFSLPILSYSPNFTLSPFSHLSCTLNPRLHSSV